jgi:hypothetical protein
LWLIFNAALDASYLPRYISRYTAGLKYGAVSGEARRDLAFLLLRIVFHVVVAVLLILHAERVLSWLVKDSVAKQNDGRDQDGSSVAEKGAGTA